MKRLMALMALLLGLASSASAVSNVQGTVLDKRAAGAFNHDFKVDGLQQFSLQIDLADAAPATVSFVGGAKSSDNVTVSSYDGLIGRKSSATITVVSGANETLTGVTITINSKQYTEGTHWTKGYTSTASATALATALDADWAYSASASSNVITVLANEIGTAGNSFTLATSNSLKLSTQTWSAGQANGYITINGTTLTHGTDFTALTSSHVTCNAIAVAINANATLSALVSVSSSADGTALGVFQMIAKENGPRPYLVTVSNRSHLLPQYTEFRGGATSDVSLSGDTFSEVAHNLPVALGVVYSTGSNLTVGGLTHGGTYYVVPVDADSFKLSDTAAHALAGTNLVDITSAGNATFVLTPQPLASAATDGITYKGSNDGVTFYTLSKTTVPYDAATAGALTEFVDYTGKYVRLTFVAPTTGALRVNAQLNGKQ